ARAKKYQIAPFWTFSMFGGKDCLLCLCNRGSGGGRGTRSRPAPRPARSGAPRDSSNRFASNARALGEVLRVSHHRDVVLHVLVRPDARISDKREHVMFPL